MRGRWELSAAQGQLIEPILRAKRRSEGRGRPWQDTRAVLNGILWVLESRAAIVGGLTQIGNTVHGAIHEDGFSCFDHLTTVAVSGVLRGGELELTSTSINGTVVTRACMLPNDSSGTNAVAQVNQDARSADGSIALSGTASFDTA